MRYVNSPNSRDGDSQATGPSSSIKDIGTLGDGELVDESEGALAESE